MLYVYLVVVGYILWEKVDKGGLLEIGVFGVLYFLGIVDFLIEIVGKFHGLTILMGVGR